MTYKYDKTTKIQPVALEDALKSLIRGRLVYTLAVEDLIAVYPGIAEVTDSELAKHLLAKAQEKYDGYINKLEDKLDDTW